jgi:hypothetical protein
MWGIAKRKNSGLSPPVNLVVIGCASGTALEPVAQNKNLAADNCRQLFSKAASASECAHGGNFVPFKPV